MNLRREGERPGLFDEILHLGQKLYRHEAVLTRQRLQIQSQGQRDASLAFRWLVLEPGYVGTFAEKVRHSHELLSHRLLLAMAEGRQLICGQTRGLTPLEGPQIAQGAVDFLQSGVILTLLFEEANTRQALGELP